ncbi:MAG: hypothetical protein K6D02_03135, partial [Lachnospiraceae bacterium]|nr:hypothetical protein [Lachnospiraceae bacterium]
MKNLQRVYFILAFSVFLILGALIFILPQEDFSPDENAYLTTLPKISVKKVLKNKFQDDFTEALSDQFPGRKFWIESATKIKKIAGMKDINDVYIGKDGYYFQKVTNSDIDNEKFDKSLKFVNLFETMNENASFMLVPSPESILTDKLPANAYVYDHEKLYNKVLKTTDKDRFIDLRKLLKEKSKEDRVY